MNNDLMEIMNVVRQMPLLKGHWLEFYENGQKSDFSFYKLSDGRNYLLHYFDHTLNNDSSSSEIMDIAEMVISEAEIFLENNYNEYVPQDTYVVFLSKINRHSEEMQKLIIRIEENDFLFKKYVCLYTEEEIGSLNQAIKKIDKSKKFWSNKQIINTKESLTSQLLLRLSIKLPIIVLDFKEAQFNSVQKRVVNSIEGKERYNHLKILNDSLQEWMEINKPEKHAELLFKEIIGEDDEL
ncbi:ABC-three component system middle component 1 [Enterococcus sp. AZ048]|uniref:ABC-three component system middle component 1 n=1 Tax=Enterococcus sp. AZ048 TaxID=2774658 RepID=UPI003F68F4D9